MNRIVFLGEILLFPFREQFIWSHTCGGGQKECQLKPFGIYGKHMQLRPGRSNNGKKGRTSLTENIFNNPIRGTTWVTGRRVGLITPTGRQNIGLLMIRMILTVSVVLYLLIGLVNFHLPSLSHISVTQ